MIVTVIVTGYSYIASLLLLHYCIVMHINAKITPTNNTDYSFHNIIKQVELV